MDSGLASNPLAAAAAVAAAFLTLCIALWTAKRTREIQDQKQGSSSSSLSSSPHSSESSLGDSEDAEAKSEPIVHTAGVELLRSSLRSDVRVLPLLRPSEIQLVLNSVLDDLLREQSQNSQPENAELRPKFVGLNVKEDARETSAALKRECGNNYWDLQMSSRCLAVPEKEGAKVEFSGSIEGSGGWKVADNNASSDSLSPDSASVEMGKVSQGVRAGGKAQMRVAGSDRIECLSPPERGGESELDERERELGEEEERDVTRVEETPSRAAGAIWGEVADAREPQPRMDRSPDYGGEDDDAVELYRSEVTTDTRVDADTCRVESRVVVTTTQRDGLDATIEQLRALGEPDAPPTPPHASRLMGLLDRDEARRTRSRLHRPPHEKKGEEEEGDRPGEAHVASIDEGEWERLMRDVLANVSEMERWGREEEAAGRRSPRADVTTSRSSGATPAEQPRQSPTAMESDDASSTTSPTKSETTTPTKVKSLRFKLDPDVFDVPSDDSFYDDDDPGANRRPWRRQPKYQTFSALELGERRKDEPVQLVSVRTSVVPAGQKMVVRPLLDIDLRIRVESGEERQSKRALASGCPSQAKRRSPVSDRNTVWCHELSPVSETVDWRDAFGPITPDTPKVASPVPNGILKTSTPRSPPTPPEKKDKENPFRSEGDDDSHTVTCEVNGLPEKPPENVEEAKPVPAKPPLQNGYLVKPPERKFPRKKPFRPDPDAMERITGYRAAVSAPSLAKPPLPPPPSLKVKNRAECARKQYFDHRAALLAAKTDAARKFQQFLAQAQSDRARIVTSSPDLGAIERAVAEQWSKERTPSPGSRPPEEERCDGATPPPPRGSTPDDVWSSYVQSCRRQLEKRHRSQSLCYLETDIDATPVNAADKSNSLTALHKELSPVKDPGLELSNDDLADDSGRAKSEHELRVEQSLRNLSLPDWYRNSEKPKSGFLLGSHANREKRGWAAAKSLASSTSSLASVGVRRPVRSLRSSRENIPWSRGSASPAETERGGQALSLALARAFREPYLGWRARTPSSGISGSPRTDLSPPSWAAETPPTTDLPPTDEEETNGGVSFDGEDVSLAANTSSDVEPRVPPSPMPGADDTADDVVTLSMDTCCDTRGAGDDTCDDLNNMSMDTCEMFPSPAAVNGDRKRGEDEDEEDNTAATTCEEEEEEDASVPNGHHRAEETDNTGDDIDNLSTDTEPTSGRLRSRVSAMKRRDPEKRFSYSQSIYHSEWEIEESRRKKMPKSHSATANGGSNKVIWIESSFVGSRTTTSIVVLPNDANSIRPASR